MAAALLGGLSTPDPGPDPDPAVSETRMSRLATRLTLATRALPSAEPWAAPADVAALLGALLHPGAWCGAGQQHPATHAQRVRKQRRARK